MQMQAALLTESNAPFSIETVTIAAPKAGEVLVKIGASGVCHSDWHVVEGATRYPMPIIVGHEGAGIVAAVGEGAARVKPGDQVALSWRPSCGECFYCQHSQVNLCQTYTPALRAGLQLDGTSRISWAGQAVHIFSGLGCFAEYVVVPQQSCVPIPADVSLEAAALLGCAVATGVGAAMYTADVRPGQSVAVYGAGGVGLNIIQGAKLCGADPIIAIDIHPTKIDIARQFGASHNLMSDKDTAEAIRRLTAGRGADHVFESVGLPALQEQALDATRPGGMLTLVGLPPMGSATNLPGAIITRSEKTIRGSYYGTVNPHRDFPRFVDLYLAGKLKLDELVTRRYRLDQINEAYAAMLGGEVARGVIVF